MSSIFYVGLCFLRRLATLMTYKMANVFQLFYYSLRSYHFINRTDDKKIGKKRIKKNIKTKVKIAIESNVLWFRSLIFAKHRIESALTADII